MRELTIYELDAQLAEPLPDRELMSIVALGSSVSQTSAALASSSSTATQSVGPALVAAQIAGNGNTNVAVALSLFS